MSEPFNLKIEIKDIRRKNGLLSHLIYFFLALIIAGIALINMFVGSYFWLLILIVCLPLFFSFERAILLLREENTLTLRMIFSGIKTYFSGRFISTYSFFRSLIKTFLISLLVSAITSIIMYSVFKANNILRTNGFIDAVMKLQNLDENAVNALMNEYSDLLKYFTTWLSLAVNFVAYNFFYHFLNRNSISLFLRVSSFGDNPRYCKVLFRQFIRERRWEFFSKYMSLNWPLYVLFILGLLGGGYLGYLYDFDGPTICSFALAMGIFLSFGLFGGFAFANKEALFKYFIPSFKQVGEDMNKRALEEMQRQVEYNAQREAFYKQLKEAMEKQEKQQEENNKENNEEK